METEIARRIEGLYDPDNKTREVLGYRNQEIEELPGQDSALVMGLRGILGILITKFEQQEFILRGENGQLLKNLSEAIERTKEGDIAGAERMLAQMQNNIY